MSEFVDLMLDGVVCQQCGQFVGDPTGAPRSCGACQEPAVTGAADFEASISENNEGATAEDTDDDDLPF